MNAKLEIILFRIFFQTVIQVNLSSLMKSRPIPRNLVSGKNDVNEDLFFVKKDMPGHIGPALAAFSQESFQLLRTSTF
jgi:hypothetical protein